MVSRRSFLRATVVLGAAGYSMRGIAQDRRPRRIGILAASRLPPLEAYFAEMTKLGYVEGHSVSTEFRFYGDSEERLAQHARELVDSRPDVLLVPTNVQALAVTKLTSTIPLVVASSHDGVGAGLFASLSRPGGNVTGGESLAPPLEAKRLELARTLFPHASRILVIHDPKDPGTVSHLRVINAIAPKTGFTPDPLAMHSNEALEEALRLRTAQRLGVGLVVTGPLTFNNRKRIAELGLKHRTALICEYSQFPDTGALLSYGPEFAMFFVRAARLVDRILRGARPSDLPVEQPDVYALVVNRHTAAALGVTIPQSVLLRADRVIE